MPPAPLSSVEGTGSGRLSFEDIDQYYQLKIRSLIRLCMPGVFTSLEQQADLRGLRAQGVVPIMFYLEFETYPRPLVFFAKAETRHHVHLRRIGRPADKGDSAARAEPERLVFDMEIDVVAAEGSGDPQALGGERSSGRMVPAGRMRGVHVLTRPVAPPGERQVRERPPELAGLVEHPWEGPAPSIEGMQSVPAGYAEREAGSWQELRSVWALHNTDINQHVNVLEYITSLENHFARMLFGAGLPVAEHHIGRMEIFFRKPFFKGQPHALRGRLHVQGARTLLLGGIHRVDPEGGVDPRPSVFARMAGTLASAP